MNLMEIMQRLKQKNAAQAVPFPPVPDPNVPPVPEAAPVPYLPDEGLEFQAQAVAPPNHPLVAAIQRKSGLLNILRNKRNREVVANKNLIGL